jgi:NADPH:quinone reductase-like Zn-dependent oxidoreductase
VRACGVNFADTMARVGLYPDAPELPAVVGYEVAGVRADTGERVVAGTRFGGYASRVVVGEEDIVPLPERLSFDQGAAIPVNYATAWAGLVRYGGLQAGERVLVQAAAGGVGIAAIQLARRYGAAEVYGAASPGKHDAVRAQGAIPVTYDARGLPKFDLVMDAIGGASFRRSYDLLDPGGRLIAFGASAVMSGEKRNLVTAAKAAVRMPRFNLIKQMSASKAVIGLNMLRLWDHAGTLGPWIEPLAELMEDGTIQPVVAEAVPFDRAPEAHRIIAQRRNVGKVVLVP